LAIASHSLIGDFFIGGNIKLLWPLSNENFGLSIPITSPTNMALEWSLFTACIVIMLKVKDMRQFLEPHVSNLLLFIPVFTVLLPAILSIPLAVPVWLEPPHLVFMILFAAAITVTPFRLFQKTFLKLRTACTQGDP
jgi:heme A synthase